MGQTSLSESLRGVEAEIAAGRPDRALALCQELVTSYPRALAVQRVLGEAYLALRKSREALGALDRALAGNPEDARACCARAIVNQIQGDTMAALAWYHRACDISPDDQVLRSAYREMASHLHQPAYRPSRAGLARLYLRGDLFPHAAREWETLLAEQPDALEAQVGLAETLWRAQLTAAAAERCRRILNNVPSCVKVLLILAAIEYDTGNGEEAQRLMRLASELDPDQRIGQALFADRFAAGDRGLRSLLRGEPIAGARDGRASSKPAPVARPFASSQPLEQAARVTGPLAPAPGGATYSTGGPAGDSYSSTMARPSGLPPDFHTIFAETEYMLWSRDEEAKGAAGSLNFEQVRTDTLARSAAIVPPVLREQGGSMDDTDARAAINWINWLQAQGARPRDPITGRPMAGPPTGAFGGKQTSAPPARGATGSMAIMPPTPTGPLPPPSPEALRAMFAELGPEAATPRVVEGELVPSADTGIPASASMSAGATGPLLPPHASAPPWSDSQAAAAGWSVAGALPESLVGLGEGAFGGEAADSARASDGAMVTLEALERRFTDSGFTNVELRPGDLASIAAERDTERLTERATEHATEHATEDVAPSWSAQEPLVAAAEESAPEAPAPEAPAPPPPEPSAPPADDYPGRLEYARRKRGSGSLDDALTEYRAILKNAPDLLSELVTELQDSLADAPDHPEIHRMLGDVHIRQGDYLSALEAYNRAVALTEGSDN